MTSTVDPIRPKRIPVRPNTRPPRIASVVDTPLTPRPKKLPSRVTAALATAALARGAASEPVIPGTPEALLDESFVSWVKNAEGERGRTKEGGFEPFASREGGLRTVGYGHKRHRGEDPLPEYMTQEEADELLKADLEEAAGLARSQINLRFGSNTFEQLDIRKQRAMVDMAFNLGPRFARIFPKFTTAVVHGDTEGALAEHKRFYQDTSGRWHEMTRRNKLFKEAFLGG